MFDSSDWGVDPKTEALNESLFGGKAAPNLKKLEKKLKRSGSLKTEKSATFVNEKKFNKDPAVDKQDINEKSTISVTANEEQTGNLKTRKKKQIKDKGFQISEERENPAANNDVSTEPSETTVQQKDTSSLKECGDDKSELPKKKLKLKKKKKRGLANQTEGDDTVVECSKLPYSPPGEKKKKVKKNKYQHLAGLSKAEKLAVTHRGTLPMAEPIVDESDTKIIEQVERNKNVKINKRKLSGSVTVTAKKTKKTDVNPPIIVSNERSAKEAVSHVQAEVPKVEMKKRSVLNQKNKKCPTAQKEIHSPVIIKETDTDSPAKSVSKVDIVANPEVAPSFGMSSFNKDKLKKLFAEAEKLKVAHAKPIDKITTPQDERPVVEKKEVKKVLSLKDKMTEKLNSARFRYLNEQLYTQSSEEGLRLFQDDPEAFQVYHEGFQSQVNKWPVNPVDKAILFIKNRPTSDVVVDFGCGDAKIAQSVQNKIHSFDLVATNKFVTVCDVANLPIRDSSVDIGVFCLSLMGTNLSDFLSEANRVLKKGGILLVAEVVSRFEKVGAFVRKMAKLGFTLDNKDTSNKMFIWFEFHKSSVPEKGRVPQVELGPCIYKRR